MDGTAERARHFFLALAVGALAVGGCAPAALPRIDPSGERIFVPGGTTTLVNPFVSWNGLPRPAYTAPPPPPPCPGAVPTVPCPAPPASVLPVPGPPQTAFPTPLSSRPAGASVTLTPARIIETVGSEVVLSTGLRGEDGLYIGGRPVEWMLAQESVGHFVRVGNENNPCWRRLLGTAPRKLSNDYARGRTSNRADVLTRGTPSPTDDIWLLRGQTWISVTSATEGTSFVTALAAEAGDWSRRRQTAVIYWVDAQWVAPSPVIGRAGEKHVLTTTLTRHTDGSPIAGWFVRYEVVDGPPAGFAPGGGSTVEVATDAAGRASVEIVPQGAQPGTSRIRIRFIRPGSAAGDAPRLHVGDAWTSVTWSAPGLSVKTTGPDTVDVDATASYRVEVSNTGDLPAKEVVVSDVIPAGLRYTGSTPPGQIFGNRIEWRLGDLAPRSVRTILVNCRAEREQQVRHCVTARSAGGLAAEGCATTRIFRSALLLAMTGPTEAEVGQTVQYRFSVANRSDSRLTNVVITDYFDPGLHHAKSASPIDRPPFELAPHETRDDLELTFTVTEPGQLCHRLEVTADGGHSAGRRVCLTARRPPRKLPPAMTVRKTGPRQARVGEQIRFVIVVTNTGKAPLSSVRIVDEYAGSLLPIQATSTFAYSRGQLVWTIDHLASGAAETKIIESKCVAPDRSACNRVTVTCDEGITLADEACVEIRPAESTPAPGATTGPRDSTPNTAAGRSPGDVGDSRRSGRLVVTVQDVRDSIQVGDRVTYLVTITNDRVESDKKVALTVFVPEGMKFERFTKQPPRTTLSKSPDGRSVSVSPIQEMRPGETIEFQLELLATLAGHTQLKVEVKSWRSDKGVTAEEDTTIVE